MTLWVRNMVLYNVIISPKAYSQLEDYLAYIQYTLLNSQAAKSVWLDAKETADELTRAAGSLKLCDNPKLKEFGYRAISFKRHNYVMLYRVEGNTAYVEAIFHQRQDYENTFSKEL